MGRIAIVTKGLGKRYGSFTALENCNITVPSGSVSALVGPNGAGKSTLLKILVGLSTASSGETSVLGKTPAQHEDFLSDIGYLAQEIPLYKNLNASDHIAMGRHLNKRWDSAFIVDRLKELGIPLNRPVGKLSGGQRAQVALALALAKKPKLLLLDEPVAALDPLAREDFLTSLTQAVAEAEGELTVGMSSHLIGDLERICDHLIILAAGKTQLCEGIEVVSETHKLLVGAKQVDVANKAYAIIQETHTLRETTLMVRLHDPKFRPGAAWQMHDANLEEIALAYMRKARQQVQPNTKGDA